ncbi:MAG: T9SS type A sorting domain-containing protein, partial [Calditrichia bacterium]|nr:T9SS type A sorting domain-containing protein [Calditrichia bacterium]
MFDGATGAVIHGDTITLHFIDGQRGDRDITANGIVTEPGAPGIPPTGINPDSDILPDQFQLFQNYPNPFNPSTTIEFELQKSSEVTLKIFNLLGEEIATLLSASLLSGSYSVDWSRPAGVASGVYLYQLQAGDYVET